ncbi:MAG: TRAP transporter large permease [Deltaproteobacteria bacterium]|nr:TRAP transporter large permease [Deltaproteobacteria bacterium]MBW1925304.1 TRAP transporter large permease [Deltaproteobacteria bacterium]MBW1950721.1 TRAP transporter large permease [Deltaproteobacteria bacterium]MBW2008785.1 TRAP transporter large permease [Deltaproteobacteria bacterium]MBW2102479.1 TRAP transporter large permease [Deltaproteobacteria bacterium]
METWVIGLIGIAVLLVLIAFRVHVAFSLAMVGLGGYYVIMGWRPTAGLLGLVPYEFIANFVLTTVPLFLLMGYLAHHAGLTRDIYNTARVWLARVHGGLAIASVAGCAVFAAACGSSLATAAMMGRVAIPEMIRNKYDQGLATGCVAAAGTIGSLIPPSILLILFGAMTETSIGALLVGGFIPGILSALIYMGMIYFRAVQNRELCPLVREKIRWRDRLVSLKGTWGILALFLLVIGGIYLGLFTPTEAGGVGATGAFILALISGKLRWDNFKESLSDTVRSTSQIFAIALGASLFTKFMGVSDLPSVICESILSLQIHPVLVVAGLSIVYIFLGMFLDPVGVMLLTLPVVFPVMEGLGFNLIWFGIIMIKYLEIGLITPPVGLNVYVIKGVVGDSIPLEVIFRGIAWFVAMDILTLAILIAFPQITLILPNTMIGP